MESSKAVAITGLVGLLLGVGVGYLLFAGGEERQCPYPNHCGWPMQPCNPKAAVMLVDIAEWARVCRDSQRLTDNLFHEIIAEVNRCLDECLDDVESHTIHVCDCPLYCKQLKLVYDDAKVAKDIPDPGACEEAWLSCEQDLEAFPSGRD